jgi:spore coat polysaccharide biosynthesis protein SpsF
MLAVIQIRSSSTRLPGKALLPLAGFPMGVLVGLRAMRGGIPVRMATSEDASDDKLARTLMQHGLSVVRGSLPDVLGRYVKATEDLPDDDVVVRLTADNVVPDGDFVKELVAAFEQSGGDYLGGDVPENRMPCGVKGEAFRVSSLRRAAAEATGPHDREHVTPWIIRNARAGIFTARTLAGEDLARFRCTVDTKEDYDRVRSLFEGISDPVSVRWDELVRRLVALEPVRE